MSPSYIEDASETQKDQVLYVGCSGEGAGPPSQAIWLQIGPPNHHRDPAPRRRPLAPSPASAVPPSLCVPVSRHAWIREPSLVSRGRPGFLLGGDKHHSLGDPFDSPGSYLGWQARWLLSACPAASVNLL